MTTKLSTKGQIVLPKEIRSSHSWGPGTEFTVEDTRDGMKRTQFRHALQGGNDAGRCLGGHHDGDLRLGSVR